MNTAARAPPQKARVTSQARASGGGPRAQDRGRRAATKPFWPTLRVACHLPETDRQAEQSDANWRQSAPEQSARGVSGNLAPTAKRVAPGLLGINAQSLYPLPPPCMAPAEDRAYNRVGTPGQAVLLAFVQHGGGLDPTNSLFRCIAKFIPPCMRNAGSAHVDLLSCRAPSSGACERRFGNALVSKPVALRCGTCERATEQPQTHD